jgi:hypothetical protein
VEIRIYFEGHADLRTGFNKFFSALHNAARSHSTVHLIAAKDGVSGYKKGCRSNPKALNILLKDSEEPLPQDPATLCQKLGIDPSRSGCVFWMVELMESWFLADPGALAEYYGFSSDTIGAIPNVEKIPKSDVMRRLKQATKKTKKGEYHKVAHAPELLKKLDSAKVQERARNCKKLFAAILDKLQESPIPPTAPR